MNVYKEALLSQGACNLGGLIHGWDRVITDLQAQAHRDNKGTDWINSHPANVLFAEQVIHLTGYSQRYTQAYEECQQKATEPEGASEVVEPTAQTQ